MTPRVKICCIASVDEALLAIRYGASALGLVSRMPSGPGVIPEERIAEIVRAVPPPIATFLLTAERDADAIADQHHLCPATAVQLVDTVPLEELRRLRSKLPGTKLVQVVHVRGDGALEEARHVQGSVDALLLDSGDPSRPVKELGGTGRVHDWQVSRQICRAAAVPVFLAGGLRPTNVGEALAQVQPFGIDVCSGVRTGGALDEEKLRWFMRALRP